MGAGGTHAHVHVERTIVEPGHPIHVESHEHIWRGYTPTSAHRERLERLRHARASHTVGPLWITITYDRGAYSETTRLTFGACPLLRHSDPGSGPSGAHQRAARTCGARACDRHRAHRRQGCAA